MRVLRHLMAAAAECGATVEDDSAGAWRVYQCVAPAGQHWRESSGPHLRVEWHTHGAWHAARDAAIDEAIRRMESGLEPAQEV